MATLNDQNRQQESLSVSIVSFSPDLPILEATLSSLKREVKSLLDAGRVQGVALYLVDNGPGEHSRADLEALLQRVGFQEPRVFVHVLSGHGNVGFGRGHNLAIFMADSDVHLVLNPDVEIEPGSLQAGLDYLRKHADVVLISPSATWPGGERQYLCKRYPTVFDLLVRGFAPEWVKTLFRKRLSAYELRHLQADVVAEVPIVSGCFMLVRRRALTDVGGFSPRYFMYFEDFDLSLRLQGKGRLVYHPRVRIVHAGGHAGRKGGRHLRMFARSALTFYMTHGWKLF